MDIRNVKDPLPLGMCQGRSLETIFDLQKTLLEGYIKIEKLPSYPINIHVKDSQLLIKDFIARVVEELSEAFESYEKLCDIYLSDEPLSAKPILDEKVMPLLNNFNEELADALHFFVELLIYCNIDAHSIQAYYKKLLEGKGLSDYIFNNTLETGFNYGRHINLQFETYRLSYIQPAIKIIADEQENYLKGGSRVSGNIKVAYSIKLWEVTHNLNLCRNMLKNKPWKQSQMVADEDQFQEQLMESFLHMMCLFDLVGLDEPSISILYFKKNKVNLFRQQSNY